MEAANEASTLIAKSIANLRLAKNRMEWFDQEEEITETIELLELALEKLTAPIL